MRVYLKQKKTTQFDFQPLSGVPRDGRGDVATLISTSFWGGGGPRGGRIM